MCWFVDVRFIGMLKIDAYPDAGFVDYLFLFCVTCVPLRKRWPGLPVVMNIELYVKFSLCYKCNAYVRAYLYTDCVDINIMSVSFNNPKYSEY